MYSDYKRAADKIHNILLADIGKAVEVVGSPSEKSAVCFLSHMDSPVKQLLDAGFGKVTAVAAFSEPLESQREKYEYESRVHFRLDESGHFFEQHKEEFDLVLFSNIHDPEDVPIYIEKAMSSLKKGGCIYFFEPQKLGIYGNFISFIDSLIAFFGTMMAGSKISFLKKAASFMGFDAGAEQPDAASLFSPIRGIDEMQVLRRLKRNACRPMFVEYSSFPACKFFEKIGSLLPYPQVFRILAVKE